MLIRKEQENHDKDGVRDINLSAFESPVEADLADKLREQAQPIISLVAEDNGNIVGHIMFSPVTLTGNPDINLMGLGPMAVAPVHQRQGIGSELVNAGLDECRKLGSDAVVVLGHAAYYPRFGFIPSSRFGIDSEYDVPEEVFMVLELEHEALSGRSGTIVYHRAFGEL